MTQAQTETRGTDVDILKRETDAARLERMKEWHRVVDAIREAAQAAGVGEMSMEEIDEEIAAYRRERREREQLERSVK